MCPFFSELVDGVLGRVIRRSWHPPFTRDPQEHLPCQFFTEG